MDSLQKNTPRLTLCAKGMLSSAIFSYRTSKDVEGGKQVFSRGFNLGGQKCPLEKNIFRSGAFNFQPGRFFAKKYP